MRRETMPGPADLDEKRLSEILELVGPASQMRLLQSLIGDLRAAREALAEAARRKDGGAISSQSHVLSSLAGTFGAPSLAAAAQVLEAGARSGTGNAAEVLSLTDRLVDGLARRLAATPPPQRPPLSPGEALE